MDGGNELVNLAAVWVAVLAALGYSYVAGKLIGKGALRLVALIPVMGLFLQIPLNLTSLHFVGFTSFFVSWLANFKLLLFAFDRGPLATKHLSLARFLAVACLPIKIRGDPSRPAVPRRSFVHYATKAFILGLVVRAYEYRDRVHPRLVRNILYCLNIYLSLDIMLAATAAAVRTTLGVELEAQFEEPYLSTSLQDFWGRRWNLMVSSILRPTVYDPLLRWSSGINRDRRWAAIPAVIGTFGVSAAMHELIFYYLGRLRPTWEITCFFLLHGLAVALEVVLKKTWGPKLRLPGLVSWAFTVAFVMSTSSWLFIPQFLRFQADARALREYAAVSHFLRGLLPHTPLPLPGPP